MSPPHLDACAARAEDQRPQARNLPAVLLSHSPSTSPSLSSFSRTSYFLFHHSVPSSLPVRVSTIFDPCALYLLSSRSLYIFIPYPFFFIVRFTFSSRDYFLSGSFVSLSLFVKIIIDPRSSCLFLSPRVPNPVDYGNTANRTFMAGGTHDA